MGIQANTVMSKAVYMRDLDDIVTAVSFPMPEGEEEEAEQASPCYTTFHDLNQLHDPDAPLPSNSAANREAQHIQLTRRKLGISRHDLLVAMRVVNTIEREIVRTEWERWVGDEARRCRQLGSMLETAAGNEKNETVGYLQGRKEELQRWFGEYCDSCQREHGRLLARTLV